MTPSEFQRSILRTESDCEASRTALGAYVRLVHAALGLCDEAGELANQVKSAIYYGRPLDRTNVLEELGDALFYIALGLDEIGSTFEEAFEANQRKLRARYPNGFSCDLANNRNLDAEIDALNAEGE